MMQEITIYQEGEREATPISSGAVGFKPHWPTPQVDAAFLATWLHGKSELTQKAYASDIQRFYATIGKPLHAVTLVDVQAFIDSLASLKPTSRARAIAAVKSALSFGVKTGYLQVNVGAVVKLPKLEDK